MVCTGKETRLLDCDFPENFGIPGDAGPASDYDGDILSPEAAPATQALSEGVPPCRFPLTVACRRFEMTGTSHFAECVVFDLD